MIHLPYRLECFGQTGWTVGAFTPKEAAAFMLNHPQAAMPCWRRFTIIGGEAVVSQ